MKKRIKILEHRNIYFQAWEVYNPPFSNIEQQVDIQYTNAKLVLVLEDMQVTYFRMEFLRVVYRADLY